MRWDLLSRLGLAKARRHPAKDGRAARPPHPTPLPSRGNGEPAAASGEASLHVKVRAVVITGVVTLGFAQHAAAQETPYVPDEWKYGRHQSGSTLQYCLDTRDPDLPVARKIGQAIAAALLLEPKPHELGQISSGEDLDNLYRVFLETCDVYLGFKLIPDAYPPWLAVTRPYYRTSYVLATVNAQWNALGDMPRSQAIGATIGTSADIRLIQYLQSLPADSQWSRFPMGSDELALRALVRGSVGAALVWGPSLWALRQNDPAFGGLRIIPPRPLPESAVEVGATLLSRETFLRSTIDQAIAALTADGTLQSILDSEKFPATVIK